MAAEGVVFEDIVHKREGISFKVGGSLIVIQANIVLQKSI
jgi:hypothetical protein